MARSAVRVRKRGAVLGWCLVALGAGFGTGGCAPPIPPRPQPLRVAEPEALVREFYRRVNAEDLPGVMALMVPEPVLIEPTMHPGRQTEHQGYREVATFFWYAFTYRQDHIDLEFVRFDGTTGEAGCTLHGEDDNAFSAVTRFDVRDGQIARVEIVRRD